MVIPTSAGLAGTPSSSTVQAALVLFSRINVKLRAAQETELNGCGPDIGEAALDELFSKLEALKDGDTLVLAGSIPPSLPEDIYERMLASLAGKAVRTVVDASG